MIKQSVEISYQGTSHVRNWIVSLAVFMVYQKVMKELHHDNRMRHALTQYVTTTGIVKDGYV